jgi:hypothetical protein
MKFRDCATRDVCEQVWSKVGENQAEAGILCKFLFNALIAGILLEVSEAPMALCSRCKVSGVNGLRLEQANSVFFTNYFQIQVFKQH